MSEILNLRCGADIGPALKAGGVDGDFLEYSNPFCEGPLFADPASEVAIQARADWMATRWQLDASAIAQKLRTEEAALARIQNYDQIRLWFEHDAYDQLILMRLLAMAAGDKILQDKMQWIVINDHPAASPRFVGLGQLSGNDLAGLVPQFSAIPLAMFDEAATIWQALVDGQAKNVTCQHLPLFQSALNRLLADLPEGEGLPLTWSLVFQAIEEGAATGAAIFGRLMRDLDPLPWYGDAMFWPILADMRQAGLLDFEGDIRQTLSKIPSDRAEPNGKGPILAGLARF